VNKEQESERQRDEFINKLRLMVPWQQWRAKVVSEALKKTRVETAREQGVADIEVPVKTEVNRFDRPTTAVGPVDKGSTQDRSHRPVTPVRMIKEALVQTRVEVPMPSQSCSEVPTPVDDEEEMLDYDPSLV
jgi:hypothetical protein